MSNQIIEDMYFPLRTERGGYKVNNYKGVLDKLVTKLSSYLNENNENEPTVRNLETVYDNKDISIIGVNTSNRNSRFIRYYIDIEIADLNRVFHAFDTYPKGANIKNKKTYDSLLEAMRNPRITSPHWSGIGRTEGSSRSIMFEKLRVILRKASRVTGDGAPYLSYPRLRHNKPIYATLIFRYNRRYKTYNLQNMELDSIPYKKRLVDVEKSYIPVDYPYSSIIQMQGYDHLNYYVREPKNVDSIVVGSGLVLPNIYNDSATVCMGSNIHSWYGDYKFDTLQQLPNEFLGGIFNSDLSVTHIYLKNLKEFVNECFMNYNDKLLLNLIPSHELGFKDDIEELLTATTNYLNKKTEQIEKSHMAMKSQYDKYYLNGSTAKKQLAEEVFQQSKNGDFFHFQISAFFLIILSNLTHTPMDALHGNHDEITTYLGSLYRLQYLHS